MYLIAVYKVTIYKDNLGKYLIKILYKNWYYVYLLLNIGHLIIAHPIHCSRFILKKFKN